MAETSYELRRELEVTRERVGDTIAALERKVNPKYLLEDYPIAALGIAFGAGVLFGGTGTSSHGMSMAGPANEHGRQHMHPTAPRGETHSTGPVGEAVDLVLAGVKDAFIAAGTVKLAMLMEHMAGRYMQHHQTGSINRIQSPLVTYRR